jgi:hypothetical protein
MWFLGAGISRTAGMPIATDLIWDLKLKHYCREENQIIDSHDINNDIIKNKVQCYMDSRGYPKLWSSEEYSFYFELTFGSNYALQQKYLADKLSEKKISLNIGHRALAGLIELNLARVIFTTNFDRVIEQAYAQVSDSNISAYHLEGSYAALEALNQERYPIYAKIHGDFRYQSLKNLSSDLLSNDQEIQKCFLAASNRFGIIITGYSARDKNVMEMFYKAIDQGNAFPFGLFWTVTNLNEVPLAVSNFLAKAQEKLINAHIVETGTFDSMLSKIWRQTPGKSKKLEEKVRNSLTREVKISLPNTGTSYPILRTNALPIVSVPTECAMIETKISLSHIDVKELLLKNKSFSIINRAEYIIGWGTEEELNKALGKDIVLSISKYQLKNPIDLILNNKGYHAFYERALVISLCQTKPLLFRKDKGFILAVDPMKVNDPSLIPIIETLKDKSGKIPAISGTIPNSIGVTWSEAVQVKMECKNSRLYLMLRPTIWMEPQAERQKHIEFIKTKLRYRYNSTSHNLLSAWIHVLFGTKSNEVEIGCFIDSNFPSIFRINTRTAFSRK